MGTWGSGGFENDTALDWMADVVTVDDVAAAFAATQDDPGRVLEVQEAETLVAAAECIAAMRGFPPQDMPAKYEKVITDLGKPSPALLEAARIAVSRVLQASELTELWVEAGAGPFNRSMTSLIARLSTPSKETGKAKGRASSKRKVVKQTCSFCDKPIERDDLFLFEIADMSDESTAAMRRGSWCHLVCLNERLHPRHLVKNWKFSKEELEEDVKRILGR